MTTFWTIRNHGLEQIPKPDWIGREYNWATNVLVDAKTKVSGVTDFTDIPYCPAGGFHLLDDEKTVAEYGGKEGQWYRGRCFKCGVYFEDRLNASERLPRYQPIGRRARLRLLQEWAERIKPYVADPLDWAYSYSVILQMEIQQTKERIRILEQALGD